VSRGSRLMAKGETHKLPMQEARLLSLAIC
jgi:hypothetical protein